ncbi:MAG: tetratricopeptide repeat protein [Chitinivibrionia bacterium]|nr:tetratricopeptide repeat protein [Chitinivibrionia bacterium]
MRRLSWIAAAFAAIVCAGLLVPSELRGGADASPRGSSSGLAALFQSANGSYERGEYEDAIKAYRALLDAGVSNADLFYNIANAYFKSGDLGRAVLWYERSLRRSPRDDDARANLKLVRSMLKDNQFLEKKTWYARPADWLERSLSLNESLVLTSMLYVLLCLAVIGFIFMDSRPVRAAHERFSRVSPGRLLGLMPRQDFALAVVLLCALVTASSGLSFDKVMHDRKRSDAVVVVSEAPVYSAPAEDSVLQFRIHAGTKVGLKEQRHGWIRVSLPGGLSGWVANTSAEAI